MELEIRKILNGIRPTLLTENCEIELLSVTKAGVVIVNLLGDGCPCKMEKMLTLIAIEKALKAQIQGIKFVTQG